MRFFLDTLVGGYVIITPGNAIAGDDDFSARAPISILLDVERMEARGDDNATKPWYEA